MAIFYEVTQTNATGFVAIPGDDRNDIIDLDVKEKYVFSAYEGFEFSVDINFRAYYIQPMTTTKVYVDILRIDVLYDFPDIALTATKVDVDTIRLSGATNNIFPNTFYKFTMPDFTEAVLPPNTTEDFYGLNYYELPQPTEIEYTYPFRIKSAAGGTEPEQTNDLDLFQYNYWNYDSARAKVIEVVSRGKN